MSVEMYREPREMVRRISAAGLRRGPRDLQIGLPVGPRHDVKKCAKAINYKIRDGKPWETM